MVNPYHTDEHGETALAAWTEARSSFVLYATTNLMSGPVVAIVATAPAHKQSGSARLVIDAALASLSALGYEQCCAMFSVGNVASERLFRGRGFAPEDN